ncbi:MAG: tetratricopeptide repeat protein [Cyclobacteriaceae bacterium]|nr:tetratricopeptide repeat protein [Cyclobacteriaceae bacterium]
MRIICIVTIILSAAYAGAQEKRIDVKKLYRSAEQAYEDASYDEALIILDKCLQENPAYAEAYLTRAKTRERLKDLQGAHNDYNIYLELVPNQPDALYSLAVLRYRLGMFTQAKEDFLKLLTLPPGETTTVYFKLSASSTGTNQITTAQSAIKPQLYNYLGLVETSLKNYAAAIQWLDSAIALQESEPDYYVNRGIAKVGNKDTTAMSDYKRALLLNPEHTAALHNVAVMKRNLGDVDASLDQLEKAIESDSSMLYPYLERAYQRMEGGYYKGALDDYNRALEINDGDPEIWLNRGIAREKLNDLKGAYSDYTQAIALNEKFEKAWLNRGNVLIKQGKYKEASEDYSAAIAFNPEYAYAFYNRAIARQKLKQTAEACEDLQKAEALGQVVSEKLKKGICK